MKYAANDLRAPWNDWSRVPQRRPKSPYFDADQVEWSVEPDLFDYPMLRGVVTGRDRSVRAAIEPLFAGDVVDEPAQIAVQASVLRKLHAAFICDEDELREVGS